MRNKVHSDSHYREAGSRRFERRPIRKIVSGGQTGVDRAALDAAMELGCDVGGWCPAGRIAEDGRIPRRYPLRETISRGYAERTMRNVRDSQGTLILVDGAITGGTALTMRTARIFSRPLCIVRRSGTDESIRKAIDWIRLHRIRVLNIAGPRASGSPGITAWAYTTILRILRRAQHGSGIRSKHGSKGRPRRCMLESAARRHCHDRGTGTERRNRSAGGVPAA
jgi:hypothetical protein